MRLLSIGLLCLLVGYLEASANEGTEANLGDQSTLDEELEGAYSTPEDEDSYDPMDPDETETYPWFDLHPWMLPNFYTMFPFMPPYLPGFPHNPFDETYLREFDPEELGEDYPVPPPPPYEYVDNSGESSESSRKRRGVDDDHLYDPDEFWYDVDAGETNDVTESLGDGKGSAIANYYRVMDSLSRFSPGLHVGEIDTGYKKNPLLERPGDRTFGQGSDFNFGDMDAFAFKPKGERFSSFDEFQEAVESGYIAAGRRFIIHKEFLDNCKECSLGKDIRYTHSIAYYGIVNPLDPQTSGSYWAQIKCNKIAPGTYTFLGMKEDFDSYGTGLKDFGLVFADQYGYQIALSNPNMKGLQALSPFNFKTSIRGFNQQGSRYTMATQPDVSHIYNSQFTPTGGRFGEDDLGTFYPDAGARAPYDQSAAWADGTGRFLSAMKQRQLGIDQFAINPSVVGQPYAQKFKY